MQLTSMLKQIIILFLLFISLNGKSQIDSTILPLDSTILSQLDSVSLAKIKKAQQDYINLMTPPTLNKNDSNEVGELIKKYFHKLSKGGGNKLKSTFVSSRQLKYINPNGNIFLKATLYSAWREQYRDFKYSSELLSKRLLINNKNFRPNYSFNVHSQSSPFPEKDWVNGYIVIHFKSNELIISISKIKGKWKIADENFELNGQFNLIYNSKKFRKADINFEDELNKIDQLTNQKKYKEALVICDKLLAIDPNELILLHRHDFLTRISK